MLQEENFIPYTVSDLPPGPYLVFAPHPDDETFGMGGTIVMAGRAGIAVHVVVLTDGQQAGDPEKRKQEAKDASQVLGLSGMDFWGLPDRELHRVTDMESGVLKILKSVKPQVVFLPSLQEFHPDHRAATFKIWSTLQKLDYSGQLWTYEIARQAEANRLIDITKVIPIKQQAMSCYKSQLPLNNYESVTLGLNQARTLTLQEGITHAEAFFEYNGWRDSCPYTASLTTLKPYWQSDSMAKDSPLVSVIIRTKDRPHLLQEALESIAAQSYSHIEIIVVNDGGKDVSSIVHSYAHAFQTCQYISLSEQQGRAAAANNGLLVASGDLIGFLDDDDLLEPTGIEHLVKAAKDINEQAPVYGIVHAVDEDGSIVFNYANPFSMAQLFLSNYIPIHAILIPKALVNEVGLMDPDFAIFEDWDWFYRMARCRAFVYTPHVIGYYRILGQATVTGRHGEDLHQKARKQFYRKHWDDLNLDTLMAIESIRLAMQHEVQELRNTLKKRENKIGALNWEVKDQQRVIAEFKEQNHYNTQRLGELEWEVKDQQRVIAEFKEQNHYNTQRLGELEWEVEDLKQALASWQARHGSFKHSLGTWLRKIIHRN